MRRPISISYDLLLALCSRGTAFISDDHLAVCVNGLSEQAELKFIHIFPNRTIDLIVEDPADESPDPLHPSYRSVYGPNEKAKALLSILDKETIEALRRLL